jgi:hypothetical protein
MNDPTTDEQFIISEDGSARFDITDVVLNQDTGTLVAIGMKSMGTHPFKWFIMPKHIHIRISKTGPCNQNRDSLCQFVITNTHTDIHVISTII